MNITKKDLVNDVDQYYKSQSQEEFFKKCKISFDSNVEWEKMWIKCTYKYNT